MIVNDKDQFLSCLGKTISWCDGKVNKDDRRLCLRSSGLKSIFENHDEDINAAWLSSRLVADLLNKRDSISNSSTAITGSGRVLLVAYDYTNFNGLTEFETGGYFDEHDNPPWDTWICEIQCVEEPREKPKYKSLLHKWWPKTLGSVVDSEELPSYWLRGCQAVLFKLFKTQSM